MKKRIVVGLLAAAGCSAAAPPPLGSVPGASVAPSAGPLASAAAAAPADPSADSGRLPSIEPLRAPFAMPEPVRPRFPDATFDIRRYGAVAGGAVKNTDAFRRAVAAAAGAGGGKVVVPAGRWLTGPIRLQSHVNLVVEAGAEILFSTRFADYLPPVFTRWEGLEVRNYSPLVYAADCTDVAITGAGKLNGQGAAWWPWKRRQAATAKKAYEMALAGVPGRDRVFGTVEAALRPSFIQTVHCKNVLIEGVTIVNGPMSTIHPLYSDNVIVRQVDIVADGPSNDGVVPDSCRNVLVEDAAVSATAACIGIKSGLNEDGWRVARRSENIVVRRVRGRLCNGAVVIGSEMSGGVRNVYVHDCEFTGIDRGLRIKSMRGRGAAVENVWYERVRHRELRSMIVDITTFYGSSTLVPRTQAPPFIRGVHVRDVSARGAKKAVEIVGLPEAPVADLSFADVEADAPEGISCVDVEHARFDRVGVTGGDGAVFDIQNARDVAVDGSCPGPAAGAVSRCVQVSGRSDKISVDGQLVGPTAAAVRK